MAEFYKFYIIILEYSNNRPTQLSNVSVCIYRKTAYNWLDDSKKSVFQIVLSNAKVYCQ